MCLRVESIKVIDAVGLQTIPRCSEFENSQDAALAGPGMPVIVGLLVGPYALYLVSFASVLGLV